MKITISVGGRMHAFYLAKYFQDKGYLHQLVTSYPKFETTKYGLETKNVTSIVSKEVLCRGWQKITGKVYFGTFFCDYFDKIAAYRMPMDSDIYVIWSGYALYSIQRIRKYNPKAIILLERGSTHILEQDELLKEHSNDSSILSDMIEKELKEYEATDIISTISLFAKSSFLKYGFQEEKIFVNNMGVDLKEFPFIDRKIKNTDEPFVVGYVGVMNKRKNIQGLIKAVEALVQKKCMIKLLLVGGIDATSFDTKLLNKDFIIYHPSMLQSELYKVYAQMEVFVLNSIEDGFGLVLLQAMSTGLPIIATTNTGAPDIVQEGKNGFVIPINDDRALADKILFCYQNRQKNQ